MCVCCRDVSVRPSFPYSVHAIRINLTLRVNVQILLISPPLSYPLPLLSLTTHLALLSTRLPRLRSERDEDPLFDDDWQVSRHLFPRDSASRPPVTLLLAAVGANILLDPTREELAVAETVLAVSVIATRDSSGADGSETERRKRTTRLCSMRMLDPPSRRTPPGVPAGTGPVLADEPLGKANGAANEEPAVMDDVERVEGVWRAPVGGTSLDMLERMIAAVMGPGGGADEVLDGLEKMELS